jgi:ubiquinone/menaquinone biosynthesis C-methylase UbiE
MHGVDSSCEAAVADNREQSAQRLPEYLVKTYHWAYLAERAVRFFDRRWVVSAILWGQYGRLKREACAEVARGQRALQAACVYGDLSAVLADSLGPAGHLTVIDVAPIQIESSRRKLAGRLNVEHVLTNAERPPAGQYDVCICFFLLHEVPDRVKRRVLQALFGALRPGGKLVIVDYHAPAWWNPLRPLMYLVWKTLEPFALSWLRHPALDWLGADEVAASESQTYFGGLYQKTVVLRRP